MISYQDFDYNGHGITFSSGPKYFMLNATKMSKPFGKRPVDWLNLSSTKEFLAAISNVRKSNICELVITKQGSSVNGGGTWFHEDVAIEFARWLSPVFAIWCNDRIKELLTMGHAEIAVPSGYVPPSLVPEVTKNDSIVVSAQRESEKDFSFSDVATMIMWGGGHIPRRTLIGWMYEHGMLRTHETGVPYPTESALSQGLFLVVDRRKRGSCEQLKKPRVRISMDGANYLVSVLQHGMKGCVTKKYKQDKN